DELKKMNPEWKSLGHAIVPLAIMNKIGCNFNTHDSKSVYEFFIYYLRAKQLNDDAHDWEEDYSADRYNYVIEKNKKMFPEDINSFSAKKIFWEEIAPLELSKIRKYCKCAISSIEKCEKIETLDFYYLLISPIAKSTGKAFLERKSAIDFINNFHPKVDINRHFEAFGKKAKVPPKESS
ncbi:MAG TPA: hypothetical protein DDX37_02665, partial [Candidatus Omnitrophica bacterium]|nr:hypothetical protein [Candidatus Omnitrophota bacterium]